MASLMTVYLSPDRSCSTSPASSVLATRVLARSPSCQSLCQTTKGCVAFSFRGRQGGEGETQSKVRSLVISTLRLTSTSQCFLFSRCQAIEDVEPGTRAVTGLLPAVKGPAESPRAARLVDQVTGRTETENQLRLEKDQMRMTKFERSSVSLRCDRMMQRSCKFTAESVIRLISLGSVSQCEASCRAESDCTSFTFHPQGGGGVRTSSPCVLMRECQETVWCRGCVTLLLSGCQSPAPPVTTETLSLEPHTEHSPPSVLLMAGGYSLDHVKHVELYSSQDSCYREVRDMPQPRSRAVAGTVGGEGVMVCGGRSEREVYSRTCDLLDLTTGHWRPGQRMGRGREDAAGVVLEERLLVVTGGWDGEELLDSVEVYNPDYETWQEATGWRLTTARYQHCAAKVGNTIIIAGGYPTLRLVQSLSLDTGEWRGWNQLTSMRGGRVAHACTVASISGTPSLIISGGQNGGEFLSSVEALSLGGEDGGTWSALTSLPLARRNHVMTAGAGSLTVAGGDTATYHPQKGFTFLLISQIETLSLEEEERGWTTSSHLISPRTVMAAAEIELKYCSGEE